MASNNLNLGTQNDIYSWPGANNANLPAANMN